MLRRTKGIKHFGLSGCQRTDPSDSQTSLSLPVLPSLHQPPPLHHTLPADAFRHSLSKILSCQGPTAQTGRTFKPKEYKAGILLQLWRSCEWARKSWCLFLKGGKLSAEGTKTICRRCNSDFCLHSNKRYALLVTRDVRGGAFSMI